jgi:hypothetical protein
MDDEYGTYVTIAILMINGLIGAAVARAKRARPFSGFAWGIVLGPIGWIIAAIVLQPDPTIPEKPRKLSPAEIEAKMVRAREMAVKARVRPPPPPG